MSHLGEVRVPKTCNSSAEVTVSSGEAPSSWVCMHTVHEGPSQAYSSRGEEREDGANI